MVALFFVFASVGAAATAAPGGVSGSAVSATAPTAPVSSTAPAAKTSASAGEAGASVSSQASVAANPAADGSLPAQQSAISATATKTGTQPTISKSKPEPSAIEAAMQASGKDSVVSSPQTFEFASLQQFGYNFFRAGSDQFAALTDIPVGPDYLLGTGDRINLTIWGSVDGSYQFEVNRNGEIVIPKVGPVKIAGVSFGQLQQLLSGQFSRIYRNFQLSVTMGKLRMITVYVVGNVNAPGDYSISSMSTLLNALSAAGGPSRSGSLRSISIRRDGRLVDTVDLYDFFLKGDKSRDIRLQPGDTVFVPSIGPVAGIVGNVRRPAIFELKNEKTLKDLLILADGIVPTGYLQRLQISRVDAYEKKSVTDVNLDPKTTGKDLDSLSSAIPIQDMDLVKIFPIDNSVRGYVRLSGYVLRPGDYAIKPGMTLKDLLPADNLLPEYHQTIGSLIRLVAPDYHPEIILINPANAAAGKPDFNLELKEFDTVKIYSRWEMEEMPRVRISGEVQRPGEYRLLEGMTVRDLLYTAGNVKLTAFLKNAEIARIHRSGTSVSMTSINIDLGRALENDPKHNLKLESFDEISVRRIPYWAEETERYVKVSGEVLFPGTYPIFKGERISDVIRRSGGFTDRAFLRGTKFTRRSVQILQQIRMDEAITRTEKEILLKQSSLSSASASKEELEATKASLDGLLKSVERLKSLKVEGRVVIRLTGGEEFKKSSNNLVLEGGDQVYIPSRVSVVNVLGQVYNPNSFIYLADRDVDYYLQKSGGGDKDADLSEMYIARADGTVFSRQQSSFGITWSDEGGHWSFGGFFSAALEEGDTLVVPQKLERTAWMREIKDFTQILANIALTAGTMLIGLR
jgi:protein involved in polysaccharide export with SLBB domain